MEALRLTIPVMGFRRRGEGNFSTNAIFHVIKMFRGETFNVNLEIVKGVILSKSEGSCRVRQGEILRLRLRMTSKKIGTQNAVT